MLRGEPTAGRRPRGSGYGFTLVELLVVVAIVGLVLALLLPAVQSARESARSSQCANNLKQQALALQGFHADHQRFPAGGRVLETEFFSGVSWRVALLPYLGERVTYDQIDPQPDGTAKIWEPNDRALPVFECPSAPVENNTDSIHPLPEYWGVGGAPPDDGLIPLEQVYCGDVFTNGVLYAGSATRIAQIVDGTSSTLAIGEAVRPPNVTSGWMGGVNWLAAPSGDKFMVCSEASNNVSFPINADPATFGIWGDGMILYNDLYFDSLHPGGAYFAYADGSVHFLSDETDITLFQASATVDGGEVIDALN